MASFERTPSNFQLNSIFFFHLLTSLLTSPVPKPAAAETPEEPYKKDNGCTFLPYGFSCNEGSRMLHILLLHDEIDIM